MKTVFVLSGEGAKGAVQAAIMHSLSEQDIVPESLYGSSSGAVNSVGYSYLGPEGLLDVWAKIQSIKDVFDFNGWKIIFKNGVYSVGGIGKILDAAISNSSPNQEVVLTIANIKTGELKYVSNTSASKTDFLAAAKASVCIPGVVHADTDYVDGGNLELAPIGKAIKDGADRIYVILGQNPTTPKQAKMDGLFGSGLLNIVDTGYRAVDLLLYSVMLADIKHAYLCNSLPGFKQVEIIVLGPKATPYGPLEFDRCHEGVVCGYDYTDYSHADVFRSRTF